MNGTKIILNRCNLQCQVAYSLVTTLCVVAIFGRSAFFPFLMLFLLSDNFGRRAAEEHSHAEHGNEDKPVRVFLFRNNCPEIDLK